MKKLTIIAFVSFVLFALPVAVLAQSAPPPGTTEEVTALPPGAVTETQEEVQNQNEGNDNNNNSTDQTQSFLTGALAGALGGFVIGAAVAWMAKNKIY